MNGICSFGRRGWVWRLLGPTGVHLYCFIRDRQTDSQTDGRTDRQRQTDSQRDRQTDKQTDRQTETDNRQTDREKRDTQRENSNSKTLILKDNSVRSIWTYLTASPCYTINTNKYDNTTNKY